MMKTLVLAGAFATLTAAAQAGSLGRPCTAKPADQWLSLDDLTAKAREQGYQVRKAKIAAACGEVYALDKSGNRVELFMDPSTGQIMAAR